MSSQTHIPVVEPNGLVHFLYKGTGQRCGHPRGLRVEDRIGSNVPASTDLWYLSYKLNPVGRYDYVFQIDMGATVPDALNAHRSPGKENWSELTMLGWRSVSLTPTSRGRIAETSFTSAVMEQERDVWVYVPDGYERNREDYPLVIVTGGEQARDVGKLEETLNAVSGKDAAPAIVALFPYMSGEWHETGGRHRDKVPRMIAGELIPFLRNTYRVAPGRDQVAIVGTGSAGFLSLNTAFTFPKSIGRVATLSARISNSAIARTLLEKARKAAAHKPLIFMEWYEVDRFDPRQDVHVLPDNALVASSHRNWGFKVTSREHPAGGGWGSWRNDLPGLLAQVMPAISE